MITLDNASNNNTIVNELSRRLEEDEQVKWDCESLCFRCFNHILNLAGHAALELITEDISRVGNFIFDACILLYN